MEEPDDLVRKLLVEIQQRMETKVLERLNNSKTNASQSVGNLLDEAYFEERENLKPIDGIAGPETIKKLEEVTGDKFEV